MSLLPIITLPDEKTLREISKPVAGIDSHVKKLWDDMLETMYEASGIGLAMARQFATDGMKLVLADIEETRLAQALEQGQGFDGAAPVARAGAFVVRHDPGGRTGLGSVGRLLHGAQYVIHLGANVRDIHTGMAAEHAHQSLHFSHVSGKGLLVKKPGRQSQCALRQCSFQQLGHDLDFAGIGGAA